MYIYIFICFNCLSLLLVKNIRKRFLLRIYLEGIYLKKFLHVCSIGTENSLSFLKKCFGRKLFIMTLSKTSKYGRKWNLKIRRFFTELYDTHKSDVIVDIRQRCKSTALKRPNGQGISVHFACTPLSENRKCIRFIGVTSFNQKAPLTKKYNAIKHIFAKRKKCTGFLKIFQHEM